MALMCYKLDLKIFCPICNIYFTIYTDRAILTFEIKTKRNYGIYIYRRQTQLRNYILDNKSGENKNML